MLTLHRQNLLCYQQYINNYWRNALSKKTFAVLNPATQDVLGYVPCSDQKDATVAIDAAVHAWHGWKKTLPYERANKLRKWQERILAHEDDLALIVTCEQGMPLQQAHEEIRYAASFLAWFADIVHHDPGQILPPIRAQQHHWIYKEPVGVCALITPCNLPASLFLKKVSAALAAGCTVVAKPAEDTPLIVLALTKLAEEIDLPKGVLNVITGEPIAIGRCCTGDHRVAKISFTGSTAVGRQIAQQCAQHIQRLSLELGGNAACVLFEDSAVETAVRDICRNKCRANGQTCIAINRIFVHRSIYDTFLSLLISAVEKITVGPGWDPHSDLGPLINEKAVQKIETLIEDVQKKGGHLVCGGHRQKEQSLFFLPTIVTNLSMDMAIAHTEIFGPVFAIYRFDTEDEVVAHVNSTPFGLAQYLYTQDIGRFHRLRQTIDAGMVIGNTTAFSHPVVPFGGIKESGYGTEGSWYGLEEYRVRKYVCVQLPTP